MDKEILKVIITLKGISPAETIPKTFAYVLLLICSLMASLTLQANYCMLMGCKIYRMFDLGVIEFLNVIIEMLGPKIFPCRVVSELFIFLKL